MTARQANTWIGPALRWTARVTGLALLGLVGVLIVGHGGLPNVFGRPAAVQLESLATVMMLGGLLLGWWREAVGGVVASIGIALFFAVEMVVNGSPPGGIVPLFCVPAILLLISSLVNRRRGGSLTPQ